MTTAIPLPLTFKLPDGWQPVPPKQVGMAANTFVAVHPASANGFTANITVAEQDRSDDATLPQLADESVQRLESVTTNVTIQNRTEVGSQEAPGLTQILRLSADGMSLIQCQFFMSLVDEHNADRHVVVELTLTATNDQFPDLVGDFQTFVSSVRLDTGE